MNELYMTLLQTMDATLRMSTPLILAAMAGLFSERSGIVNIALEGKMLGAAFAAAAVAHLSGNAWIGMMAGMGLAVLLSLLHGLASITYRGDQIISGLAINMLMSGFTMVVATAAFKMGGRTPSLSGDARFTSMELPLVDTIGPIPVVGSIYRELISGHTPIVYIAILSVPLVWWLLFKTKFGLHLRATGENAHAVDTAGISVVHMRYMAMILCGILVGIAGAYIGTAQNAQFNRDMTAGQGYMALAALIFGKWQPRTILIGCLLFGVLDALSVRLQGVEFPLVGTIPTPLIQGLPYLLTIILLAGFIGKAIPPKGVGIPFVKER